MRGPSTGRQRVELTFDIDSKKEGTNSHCSWLAQGALFDTCMPHAAIDRCRMMIHYKNEYNLLKEHKLTTQQDKTRQDDSL
eukprot:scaffold11319_cov99-Skeletonema_marinoi.AAC.2